MVTRRRETWTELQVFPFSGYFMALSHRILLDHRQGSLLYNHQHLLRIDNPQLLHNPSIDDTTKHVNVKDFSHHCGKDFSHQHGKDI